MLDISNLSNIPTVRMFRLLGYCLKVFGIGHAEFARRAGIPCSTVDSWVYKDKEITFRNGSRGKAENEIFRLCHRNNLKIEDVLNAAEELWQRDVDEKERKRFEKEGKS